MAFKTNDNGNYTNKLTKMTSVFLNCDKFSIRRSFGKKQLTRKTGIITLGILA